MYHLLPLQLSKIGMTDFCLNMKLTTSPTSSCIWEVPHPAKGVLKAVKTYLYQVGGEEGEN